MLVRRLYVYPLSMYITCLSVHVLMYICLPLLLLLPTHVSKLAFGQTNGHFNVPCPPVGDDKKSNENRLNKWVQSLHAMHRDERVVH